MSSSTSSWSKAESVEQKVAKFEMFINDVLKDSLKQISTALDMINEQIAELEDVRDTVETMSQLACELPAGKSLKTRVNVGCDFFMQANADVRTFLVCVGLGYYVEYTKDETLAHVQVRSKLLKERADELRDKGARVRAQITLALHCIQEVQGL
ncbi:protein UXT [Aphis craccivora]|uniref:Protein UXT n=1 Tax=Aphis craccivora TaxID=307492 RepID=A0A6G0ZMC4_APHCR|nr:protein UXT [Aphis craccivora]